MSALCCLRLPSTPSVEHMTVRVRITLDSAQRLPHLKNQYPENLSRSRTLWWMCNDPQLLGHSCPYRQALSICAGSYKRSTPPPQGPRPALEELDAEDSPVVALVMGDVGIGAD